jgi:hypothetical protein
MSGNLPGRALHLGQERNVPPSPLFHRGPRAAAAKRSSYGTVAEWEADLARNRLRLAFMQRRLEEVSHTPTRVRVLGNGIRVQKALISACERLLREARQRVGEQFPLPGFPLVAGPPSRPPAAVQLVLPGI